MAYDKCEAALKTGKQAMVFVHSRKDTVKTARQLAELAANSEQGVALFTNAEHPETARFVREVNRSRNQVGTTWGAI